MSPAAALALSSCVAVCLGWSSSAWTREVVRCDHCDDAQTRSIVYHRARASDVYVLDMALRQLRHFYLAGPDHSRVTEIALAPDEAEFWRLALRYFDGNGGSFSHLDHLQVDLRHRDEGPPEIRELRLHGGVVTQGFLREAVTEDSVTAPRLARDANVRKQVGEVLNRVLRSPGQDHLAHLAQSTGLEIQELERLLGIGQVPSVPLSLPTLSILIETTFPDGSSGRWAWRPEQQGFAWLAHSARDALRQSVPEDRTAHDHGSFESVPVLGHLETSSQRCRGPSLLPALTLLPEVLQRFLAHLGCRPD